MILYFVSSIHSWPHHWTQFFKNDKRPPKLSFKFLQLYIDFINSPLVAHYLNAKLIHLLMSAFQFVLVVSYYIGKRFATCLHCFHLFSVTLQPRLSGNFFIQLGFLKCLIPLVVLQTVHVTADDDADDLKRRDLYSGLVRQLLINKFFQSTTACNCM